MGNVIDYADIVVGLAWGDEGKGKVTSKLSSSGRYTAVARWAGGNNAGHTVVKEGIKYKTHLIPSGVFYGIKSIIGPGCVIHPESFFEEVAYLRDSGFDVSLIKISPRCHVVTEEHIEFDRNNLAGKLGTTSKGIAPVYAAKAARTGILAKDVPAFKPFLWDENLNGEALLCEGAQGVWLDVDYGEYPFVTSSVTLSYGACSIGFPPQKIRKVYGVAKIYDTRSGTDPNFPISLLGDELLLKLGDLGGEKGVTTGRRRKVNWLNFSKLIESINLTGVTNLIINKCDILEELGEYRLFLEQPSGFPINATFPNFESMKIYISKNVQRLCPLVEDIKFSYSPEDI